MLLLVVASCLSACATTQSSGSEPPISVQDPFEKFNRSMFAVNRFGDRFFYKPFGKAYRTVVPNFARKGVGNFFENFKSPRYIANNVLQGKPGRAFDEFARFFFNTTIGIGGLFDVAAAGGMPRNDWEPEDFAQTLAVWGVPDGPYLVIPIWGPRTLLSAVTLPVDIYSDVHPHIRDTGTRDKLWALRLIDTRARLLEAEESLNKASDPYVEFRESYLQNRQFLLYDGDPPIDPCVEYGICD